MQFKSHEVISYIHQKMPDAQIIVEVGAYNGHDTVRMAYQWPDAHIYAWEPVPEIFERLVAHTAGNVSVYPIPYALSNNNGTALFYIAEKPEKFGFATQAGSLLKPYKRLTHSPIVFPRYIEVSTYTLSHWIETTEIKHIDLLWLDTQGMEWNILTSAVSVLPCIRYIFTEVGFDENYHGQKTYHMLRAWLKEHNFEVVGQDFNDQSRLFFGNILCENKAYLPPNNNRQ